MPMQQTFAILKPDAVAAGHTGQILSVIEHAGFRIRGMKMTRLSKQQAEGFYEVHKERPFFPCLIAFMTEGPVVVLVLEREDAIKRWREVMGATNPEKAEADTIRKKFRTAVTDSGREVRRAADKPGVSNLVDILAVATGRSPEDVEAAYDGKGYGDLKTDVGEAVVAVVEPVRERYLELRADEPELLRLLAVGAAKATAASAPTLEAMYERMGFMRSDDLDFRVNAFQVFGFRLHL